MRADALTRRIVALLNIVLAISLIARPALAADPDIEARAQFERGVAHADRGEIDAAIEAFEGAYRARPHPAVLFNLGQAYSASGRPLEALRALRAYITQASPSEQRKAEAEQLIRYNEARIGRVLLEVTPRTARLFLDGRPLGPADALKPLELAAGAHMLVAEASGHRSLRKEVQIRPWREAETRIALTLEPEPKSAPTAVLRVATSPRGARVEVDGAAYEGAALAAGPHWVAVSAEGHERYQRRIDVSPGQELVLEVALRPAPESALAKVARRRRIAAYVTGAVGVLAGGTALALHLVNNGRAADWDEMRWHVADEAERKQLLDDALSIQRVDDARLGCAIAGGALVTAAVTLWFLSRRERPQTPRSKVLTFDHRLDAVGVSW